MANCGKCNADFTKGKKKEQAMQCDICERWYHSECTDIPDALFRAMSKHDVKAVKWLCEKCNVTFMENVTEMREKQAGMEREMEKMKREMEEMKEKMKEDNQKMNERMERYEAEMVGVKSEIVDAGKREKTGKGYSGAVKQGLTEKELNADLGGRLAENGGAEDNEAWQEVGRRRERELQVQVVETMEREKRKNNLIITVLSEEMSDKETEEFVAEMLSTVVGTEEVDMKVHGRLGRKESDKKRPVRVEISDAAARRTIMKKAINLKKEPKYEKIYVSPDLTRKQQEMDKALRDKVKELRAQGVEGVKINKGCVVKEVEGGTREVLYNPNH